MKTDRIDEPTQFYSDEKMDLLLIHILREVEDIDGLTLPNLVNMLRNLEEEMQYPSETTDSRYDQLMAVVRLGENDPAAQLTALRRIKERREAAFTDMLRRTEGDGHA